MTRLASEVAALIRQEVESAGGREVSFVAEIDSDGMLTDARPVARGTVESVLALPGVARRGEMLVHNHPSGVLEPSQADLTVAARLHDSGIGFGIVDNEASSIYVVVEVPRARPCRDIDAIETADLLGPGGPVAKALGRFEDRRSQRDMAAYVADTFNEGGVSLVEAGTGVGKSFAYLVPALEWAQVNDERTVVSTNTINLQEQLVGKDLPLLAKAFSGTWERPVTFALLKGWRNYLCLQRLELSRSGQGALLEADRHPELEELAAWAARTADGSLSDLPDQPSPEVWDEVSAEADLCTRLKCPHFDKCFVFAARRRAAEADVVVVNHHLLASDIAVRQNTENWQDAAVLPPYRRLVLDEAHHVEDTAAHHLGSQMTWHGLVRLLGRLERNGKGLIPTLIAELRKRGDDDLMTKASLDLLRMALLPAIDDARAHATQVFGLLAELLSERNESVLRVEDGFASDPIWDRGLAAGLDSLVAVLRRVRDGVETVADRLELDQDPERRVQIVNELRGVVRRLEAVMDGMLLTLRFERGAPTVRWIERRGVRPTGALPFPIGLQTVPLDLATILKDHLFDRVDTVILTSATLTTSGDFDFLKGRLGLSLPPSRVRFEEALPSPFEFSEQCTLGIPNDLPNPRGAEADHDRAVADAIQQLAYASDGGMFVLFTSHAALRRTAALVRTRVRSTWPLLVQGEGPRDRLLRRFRSAGSAILFGTDSFWEGVDVPGRALRALVIAKLPFKAPTEPITAARLERLAESGEDGFMRYLVPHAALKLKQGFGRLIRSTTDFGVVVILDHRIISRNYGEVLMRSLPPARQVIGSWEEVRTAAEQFFQVVNSTSATTSNV